MAKYYKMIVTTTYSNEIIVKANSLEEAKNAEESIINRINLLDDIPEVNVETYERDDYDDDDVDFDVRKTENY